jgi:hypothetical protein
MGSWNGRSSEDCRDGRPMSCRTWESTKRPFLRGHRYATIVVDIWRSRVLYVAPDRDQASLNGFWSSLTARQLSDVEMVAMDMWQPYVNSVQEHVPNGANKIVFDKFQVRNTSATPSTKFAGRKTRSCVPRLIVAWWEPSTTGFGTRAISIGGTGRSFVRCATAN